MILQFVLIKGKTQIIIFSNLSTYKKNPIRDNILHNWIMEILLQSVSIIVAGFISTYRIYIYIYIYTMYLRKIWYKKNPVVYIKLKAFVII